MSLINEALRKAQQARSGESAGDHPTTGAAPSLPGKRGQPRSIRTVLWLTIVGAGLVLVSVLAASWFFSRPAAETPAPAAPALPRLAAPEKKTQTAAPVTAAPVPAQPPVAAPKPAGADVTPSAAPAPANPVVAATTVAAPAVSAPTAVPPASATPTVAATAEVAPSAPTATHASAASRESTALPASPAPPIVSTPARSDERVHAFVDSIKVTGVRSSGSESRVLMNDRVFRVNEIVDRNLGLRLTAVQAGTLTFTDANGAVYTKKF